MGRLAQSEHVGAEFVSASGKTYEAMGVPDAYRYWNESDFTKSIVDHLNKSVDFVAIDLSGASKGQIGTIQSFVEENLTVEQQKRIIFVGWGL